MTSWLLDLWMTCHSGVQKTPAGSDGCSRENAEKETVLSGKMPTGGQATLGEDSQSPM